MTRTTEAGLLVVASGLAAFGFALVNLAGGGSVDAPVGLAFLTVLLVFGGLWAMTGRYASAATPFLLPPVALIAVFGLVEIYRLDPGRAGLQQWWLAIGGGVTAAALVGLDRAGLDVLRRYRNIVLLITVTLLLLPLLPSTGPLPVRGLEAFGSRLWIVVDLGVVSLNFQPGELAKIGFVVFVAGYLSDRQPALSLVRRRLGPLRFPEPRQLMPLIAVWVGSIGILVSQRDLGASVLLFAAFITLLYMATGESGYLWTGALLTTAGGVAAWRLFDHVQRRVTAWIHPWTDYDDAGYQIAQSMFALGTGSLAGSGPGLGRPDLVPNATTDFIFAAVGEELGFAGTVAVLCLFALVVAAGFGVALRARDRFRKLLAGGLTAVLGIQTFLILGGVLRIVPLTGIAMPFMSYGGSSLVGNLVLVALLLRISHEEAT